MEKDKKGRFIKLLLSSEDTRQAYTISNVYFEPNFNQSYPNEILNSNIVFGDLNNFESGLTKEGVYHYKNSIIKKK